MSQVASEPREKSAAAIAAHADLLAHLEVFASLDRLALAHLAAYLDPVPVQRDTIVVRQGEPADAFYIVAEGELGVYAAASGTNVHVRLDTLRQGECFGEIGLLADEPRSATVRAESDGEVLRLERERFLDVASRDPAVFRTLGVVLGRRLRSIRGVPSKPFAVEPLLHRAQRATADSPA